MERLTTKELYGKREMVCRCEDCHTSEEYCPHINTSECNGLQEVLNKLGQYEDLEEQELLLRLPCKVGDTVYVVPSNTNYGINIVNGHEENNRIYYQKVHRIQADGVGAYSLITCEGMGIVVSIFLGETWFLTENEAEDKLRELDNYWKKQLRI